MVDKKKIPQTIHVYSQDDWTFYKCFTETNGSFTKLFIIML